MASLKEIKGRIASVGSTLKITSAMKLVASSKLRKAQQAIGNMLPYDRQLHRILVDLMATTDLSGQSADGPRQAALKGSLSNSRTVRRVAIVAFASNSSLCGAFNSNAIRETLAVINEYRSAGLRDSDITVYPVGRKMQDAMKKAGFLSPSDYIKMADSPNYDAASSLAQELLDGFSGGRFDKVELVYNHYKSTACQPTIRKTYLPLSLADASQTFDPAQGRRMVSAPAAIQANNGIAPASVGIAENGMPSPRNPEDLIVEPCTEELIEVLLPKVVRLRIYTTLLDSNAAEHAARTVAMQTATDNGNDLLNELKLEYNKGRQQKITSEILDIVGGSMQQN